MRTFLLLILLGSSGLLKAQGREQIVHTDSGTVVLHYFTNGRLSTKAWMDKDDRWGRTWAYKQDGSVIVEHQTRRIAGHASVHFEYHPNGAIRKVEFSDVPDGGIQWYRSTTTFDEAGNKTGFSEQGHDNDGLIPRPDIRVTEQPVTPPPAPQEVAIEQHLFVNEVLVVNPTASACRVKASTTQPSPALPGGQYTMAPGDTIRLGSYTIGEQFEGPEKHVTVAIHEVVLGNRRNAVALIGTEEVQISPEHRRYYLVIRKWDRGRTKARRSRVRKVHTH